MTPNDNFSRICRKLTALNNELEILYDNREGNPDLDFTEDFRENRRAYYAAAEELENLILADRLTCYRSDMPNFDFGD